MNVNIERNNDETANEAILNSVTYADAADVLAEIVKMRALEHSRGVSKSDTNVAIDIALCKAICACKICDEAEKLKEKE